MKPQSFITVAKQGQRTHGFTFVELLVVMAVVGLLGLTLLPVLARTKGDSRGFQCLNNNRELNRAWRMWTDDNNDLLLYASHNGSPSDPNNQRAWLRVDGLDYSSAPKNWDVQVTLAPSPMWPYCRSNASIWRCPSDESYVVVNGLAKPRVFSYSMNIYLGGYAGSTPSDLSPYRLYLKSSDVTVPSPDRLFVFLDQRADSINWGSFVTVMDGYSPRNTAAYKFEQDWPGLYHDGAATFSYADGHGEIHRWQDPRTTPPPMSPPFTFGTVPSPRNPDIAWLQDRATRPK